VESLSILFHFFLSSENNPISYSALAYAPHSAAKPRLILLVT